MEMIIIFTTAKFAGNLSSITYLILGSSPSKNHSFCNSYIGQALLGIELRTLSYLDAYSLMVSLFHFLIVDISLINTEMEFS